MKREEIERLIVQVSTYEKGTIPFMCACDQLLSEFDRLKLRVASLAADLWDANAALDEAQSWLGTISEPFRLGQIVPANILRCLREDRYKSNLTDVIEAIAAYLDSQKPSEKQHTYSHWYRRDEFHFDVHEGKPEDCPICNPKPCSNCKETKQPCACMRNLCIKCGKPVGNITFTYCDDCWEGQEADCPSVTQSPSPNALNVMVPNTSTE